MLLQKVVSAATHHIRHMDDYYTQTQHFEFPDTVYFIDTNVINTISICVDYVFAITIMHHSYYFGYVLITVIHQRETIFNQFSWAGNFGMCFQLGQVDLILTL